VEHLIDHGPDGAQRMILRDAPLGGEEAKHGLLVPIVSAHREPSARVVRI
jgi:hypothetical protein